MLVNLAVLQELIAGAIPEREAVLWDDRVVTYADLNRRSRQLGHALLGFGLGCHTDRARLQPWESGQDHVALYLYNGTEFLEGLYGALKARAVPININYRYVEEELVYVLAISGAKAIIYHSAFAPRLAAIRDQLPALRHLIQVTDDSGEPLLPGAIWYEGLLGSQATGPLDLPYSADDLYILYTGGTTGMPKGVVWRHEDVFYNGLGGHIPGFNRIETEAQLLEHINMGLGGRALICAPFMHGAGQWTAFNTFHRGGTVVLPKETRRLDPHAAWSAVERHQVDSIGLIGDSFALPLLRALREKRYETASVRVLMSTAAVLSASVREELLSHLPASTLVVESIGATEAGLQAMSYDTRSAHAGLPAYDLRAGSVILSNDRRRVLAPGAGSEVGWIASTGHLPLGYLGEPERTQEVFPVIDGVRYSITGDRARYGENGRVLFLGRESSCINTGGEKVYVEEVERIVKSHPAVHDTLVVGVRSERWGQQVTAVIVPTPGQAPPTIDDLRSHCRTHLADYKIPRALVTATEIVRSPSGKPDYAWARQYAEEQSTVESRESRVEGRRSTVDS